MQSNKKHSFVRRSPLAYVVVPLVFTAISAVIFFTTTKILLAPYQALISWVLTTTEVAQPQDLLANAATVINGGAAEEASSQPDSIPLSSVTYPTVGDRYATITVSGTNVDAPVFYGDTNKILNQGVGTYADNGGAGIPGEGKTILLEGQLGTLRDPDHGIYPYTTSSSPLAGFGTVGAGVPPTAYSDIVCVT